MKAIIIILGVGLGTFLGFFPNNKFPKPLWWKLTAIFLMSLTIALALLPPIAGNFADAFYISAIGRDKTINVNIPTKDLVFDYQKDLGQWTVKYQQDNESSPYYLIVKGHTLPAEFRSGKNIIIKTKFDKTQNVFNYYSTEFIDPYITLPYIPDLEERVKILNFHVPMSWIAVLAYLISMIYSIKFLRKRDFHADLMASSTAVLGTLFTVLATVTGMIWAKFNWGSFWNWDPRETSIFVLLLIYFAYFALRSSIENREVKARLSAVYSIIAFVTVPFLIFVLPRILSGLHPGSADDTTSGPILSSGSDTLNFYKQIIFSLSLGSFTLIFFWLLNIFNRFKNLEEHYD